MHIPQNNALYKLRVLCCVNRAPRQWHPLARILFGSKDLVIPTYVQFSFDARTGGVRRLLRVRQLFVRPLRRPPLLGPRPRRVRLRQVHVQLGVGHARSVRGRECRKCNEHCLTRSDVTSVERGVRMSQCGQAPLGMRIEGVGDSHFS